MKEDNILDGLGSKHTDMTLSYKVGKKILECRRTEKEKSKGFSHTTAVVTIVQKESQQYSRNLMKQKVSITYQVGVPFLGQSRACGTTVSFQALYVRRIPIKYGIQWEYFSPGELPRRLYERIH